MPATASSGRAGIVVSADKVGGLRMATKPGDRIGAAGPQLQPVGASMGSDRFHQPGRRASAAQLRFGLDMNQGVDTVADAIIREHQHVFFGGLKTLLFGVVDQLLLPPLGSRYIQGRDRPMGTIQNVPAKA